MPILRGFHQPTLYRIAVNTVLMHFCKKALRQISLDEPYNQDAKQVRREYGSRDDRSPKRSFAWVGALLPGVAGLARGRAHRSPSASTGRAFRRSITTPGADTPPSAGADRPGRLSVAARLTIALAAAALGVLAVRRLRHRQPERATWSG